MPPPPATRRRWFSYSLRSLFVLVTLAAIALGWLANERRQSQHEMEIAEQLRAKGAEIVLFGLFDSEDFVDEQSRWRRALSDLCKPRVRTVDLNRNRSVTDLAPFAGLRSLERLWLHSTQVSNLSPLSGLEHLQILGLYDTQVSDLSPLAGLKSMKSLGLRDTKVKSLLSLAELENLRELYLNGTQVTDLSPLAGLTSVKRLNLDDTQVHDLSPLAGLECLQELHLDCLGSQFKWNRGG